MEEKTGIEEQIPTTQEKGGITSTEKEKRKPKVFLVYGHHSINEAIAKTVAPRMETSQVALKTDLKLIEQPKGLCYVDAYFAAKQKADPQSEEFYKVYASEAAKRLRNGYEASFALAHQNSDATFIDVHEMPAGLYEEEGIYVKVPDCDEACLVKLKGRLKKVLPSGKEESFLTWVHQPGIFRERELRDLTKPNNYITVELVTNPDLYEKIAETDEARMDYFYQTSGIRRLKDERKDFELKKRINHERTKYARILELAIPIIAGFMEEKRGVFDSKPKGA